MPTILPIANADLTLVQRLLFGSEPSAGGQVVLGLVVILAVFIPLVLLIAMFSIWFERKVAGHIQSRFGPNRVGPIGALQSLADGIKLILKEDLIPKDADRLLFRLAPYIAFAPVFAAFLALPFGPDFIFEPALSVGLFLILAVLGIEVMGVILAGWASNNKWAVFGAMREACQMVSYEIPLGISILVGVMACGTLNLVTSGHQQGGGLHTWLIFANPFTFAAFFCYFVASLASNKRAPFDLPESESELVAGFHTEYSGMRFAFFFFAEYAAMWVVAGVQVALFLGAWHDPFGLLGYYHARYTASGSDWGLFWVNVIASGMFLLKLLALVYVQMWIRWTLPRPRIDQVLYVCVKVLLPLACALLLGAAVWQVFAPSRTDVPWVDYHPFSFSDLSAGVGGLSAVTRIVLALIGLAGLLFIKGWIVAAWLSSVKHTRRLTDPAPAVEGGA